LNIDSTHMKIYILFLIIISVAIAGFWYVQPDKALVQDLTQNEDMLPRADVVENKSEEKAVLEKVVVNDSVPAPKIETPPKDILKLADEKLPSGLTIKSVKTSPSADQTLFIVTTDNQAVETLWLFSGSDYSWHKFFSSIEYPDFKNAGIGSISPNGKVVRLILVSCTGCDGSRLSQVVYDTTIDLYQNLNDPLAAFRFTTGNDFEYKKIPVGCEAHFNYTFEQDINKICDEKLAAMPWSSNN
jgi:hypothetical protein